MFYGKGGVGFVNDRYNVPGDIREPYDFDGSETALGWTAGVGVEWAVSDDWSVKLEYDYYGFGTRNVTFIDQVTQFSGSGEHQANIQTIKLGLNFTSPLGDEEAMGSELPSTVAIHETCFDEA